MNHPMLEACAMEWLRYGKLCHIVTRERGQRIGRPDVLAVNAKGFLVEIEVKRTLADFKRDAAKPQRTNPSQSPNVRQFSYLVPPELVVKVQPLLPPGAGLLTLGPQTSLHTGLPEVVVVRQASPRLKVKPLTPKRIWELTRDMAGALVTAEISARKNKLALSQFLKAAKLP